MTAATFHSVCARMLREHAGVFGRTDAYTVYDQADVRKVIEWLLSDAQRGAIQAALADCGQPASRRGAGGDLAGQEPAAHPRQLRAQPRATRPRALVAAVWREVDVELRRSNAFDFDDLLVYAVRLLAEHPHRLAFYRQRWQWLLVDEFQDTNEAQSVLVALLAGAGGNVTVVGRRRSADLRLARRRAAQRARASASATPATRGSCSAATSAAGPRSSTPPSPASRTTSSAPPRR